MNPIKNTLKLLGLGFFVVVVSVGCITSKFGPTSGKQAAAAPAAASKAAMGAKGSGDVHVVQKGECLWCISKLPQIYGDPFQWPLIFAANAHQIKDADLIYPGQKLTIRRGMSQAVIDQGIQHARGRGAWSLGYEEPADKEFLKKAM